MQKYEVKGTIYGFDNTKTIQIHKIDELFSTMQDVDNKDISFTIVNPYMLREYSFDMPSDVKILLEIHEESNVSAYNIVVVKSPMEDSTINFLAPIIINNDNHKIAQAILKEKNHTDLGISQSIKSFKTKGI
ncbi:MAG: flagellar assembly protein FliW [Sulfurimonas sp.]|nr:flagellar assembly protein FliW [Sulfurimonas sp.]